MVRYNFEFDAEQGVATCILTTKQGKVFVGMAICHPDDRDMMAQYTGQQIAEHRAIIKMLQDIRDNELKSQLKVLKMLQTNMSQSQHYNPKSYEACMLRKTMKLRQDELNEIKLLIRQEKEDLHNFINDKDKAYKKVRAHRAEAAHKGQN